MRNPAIIDEPELRLFARLASPRLRGIAARGSDPHASRDSPGSGLEFLDFRDYQPGDDIRHVDWRQTARRQQAVTRRFRNEAAADWFICVDCSASVGMVESKWTMTVRLATALAYTCLFSGHRVAMLLFDDRIQGMCHLGRGAHQFTTLLNLLGARDADSFASKTIEPKPGNTRSNAASRRHSNLGLCRDFLSRSSNIFVISDFLASDGMRPDVQAIRSVAASTSAIQVLADDEIKVPVSGLTNLFDVESGERRQLVISQSEIAAANRALTQHGVDLRRDCNRLGVPFTTCRSGDAWQKVLIEHLSVRA
jgi:uncharacterized protein (DUF58 family)